VDFVHLFFVCYAFWFDWLLAFKDLPIRDFFEYALYKFTYLLTYLQQGSQQQLADVTARSPLGDELQIEQLQTQYENTEVYRHHILQQQRQQQQTDVDLVSSPRPQCRMSHFSFRLID